MTLLPPVRPTESASPDVLYISRKHPPSLGGMQKLSARLVAGLREKARVTALVHDCSRWSLAPFLYIAMVRLGSRLVLGPRPRIVHFGDPLVAVLAPVCRLAGISTVVTVHGLDVTYPHPLYQLLLRIGDLGIDRYIAISREARDACLRRGISADRCALISPGVDIATSSDRLTRAALSRVLGLPDFAGPVLLTVGRLVPRKGVAWFVENVLPGLVARQPALMYVVVGDGPDRERIKAATERVGCARHVALVGRVQEDVLRLCHASADLFIMPNVPTEHDVEGFGLVAVEAAAAGLPVVASNLEGIRDAIQHEKNGLLVPPRESAVFREVILRYIEDEPARLELGRRAADFTRVTYGWDRMTARYIEEYERAMRSLADRLEK